jgi:uncharacterized membrane protein
LNRTAAAAQVESLLKPEKFTTLQRLSLAAICIVYILLRFWNLTSSCLWFDEIFSIHAAEHPWSELLWFVVQDLIHPPLFYAVLKTWIGLGGEGLFWLRSLPVFISILALVPFLHLCRELKLKFSTTAAALLLFAVNGALIKYAQEVRMYSLLLFLSSVSIWLFSRFYFRGKNIWILTVVNVLLVFTQYFGWFVVASEIVAILIFQRIKIRHVLAMLAITTAAFVPWLVMVVNAWRAGADVNQNIGWIERPMLKSMFDLLIDLIEPFHFQQSSIDPSSVFYISIPLLLLIVYAKVIYLINFREREDKGSFFVLLILASVPVAIAFLLSWSLPVSVWGSRHLIVVFPAAIVIAAIVVTEIPQRRVRSAILSVAALLITAAFVLNSRIERPVLVWCAWERFAEDVKNSDPPGLATIYTFEDLSAYHIWFALRDSGNFSVKVVKGIEGLREDSAYFLPRGFQNVETVNESGITGDSFWVAYRAKTFDPEAPPIANLATQGYHKGEVKTIQAGPEQAFLVEMTRRP